MKSFCALVFVTFALPAFAADPPREIDFTQSLTGANGVIITQQTQDGKSEPMTLGDAALISLLTLIDEDRNLDAKKKFERDRLARRIYKNQHAVLSPEDQALIKERIGKVYGPAQVGAAWPLLDPTLQ